MLQRAVRSVEITWNLRNELLANTSGGEIYLGVENDGTPTGVHVEHRNLTGLAAMIANRTIPPISVRVEALEVQDVLVAKIAVPRSIRPVSTAEGVFQRRRLMADGTPQCIPFYPHEFIQRDADLGVLDYSAMPVRGVESKDFDPLERERLRQMIGRYGGDASLIGLDDDELEGALGFVRSEKGKRIPTVAGLLVLGREGVLRELLPAHEVAFQILEGVQVRINEFYRFPLLKIFERVMDQFSVRVVEDEVQEGLFRVPVPNYSFQEKFFGVILHMLVLR
jgi:ATP-dependent DNA helicase RecG